jgi:hypothetical protein
MTRSAIDGGIERVNPLNRIKRNESLSICDPLPLPELEPGIFAAAVCNDVRRADAG